MLKSDIGVTPFTRLNGALNNVAYLITSAREVVVTSRLGHLETKRVRARK